MTPRNPQTRNPQTRPRSGYVLHLASFPTFCMFFFLFWKKKRAAKGDRNKQNRCQITRRIQARIKFKHKQRRQHSSRTLQHQMVALAPRRNHNTMLSHKNPKIIISFFSVFFLRKKREYKSDTAIHNREECYRMPHRTREQDHFQTTCRTLQYQMVAPHPRRSHNAMLSHKNPKKIFTMKAYPLEGGERKQKGCGRLENTHDIVSSSP